MRLAVLNRPVEAISPRHLTVGFWLVAYIATNIGVCATRGGFTRCSPEARQTSQVVILTILTHLTFLGGSQDTGGMTLCRCLMAVYVVTKKGVAILAGVFPVAPRVRAAA